MMTAHADALKAMRQDLEAEHAALWRSISMSPEWLRMMALDAQISLLNRLLGDSVEQPDTTAPKASLVPERIKK